jgi:hypothetical protein
LSDLDVDFFVGRLRKDNNGDLYTSSFDKFISNGDPSLSVEKQPDLFLTKLYPNPASSYLNVEFYTTLNAVEQIKAYIYDVTGTMLKSFTPETNFNNLTGGAFCRIDVSSLQKGFYIFTISNGNWTRAGTFIKN